MNESQRRVLLTVSGTIPSDLDEQIADGRCPTPDYRVMSEAFDADVVDIAEARRRSGRPGRVAEAIGGGGVLLAWFCFRRRQRYDVIVTDGEQVGIPLAALCRLLGRGRARHMMIAHIISIPKKTLVIKALRLATIIDTYVVYCSFQQMFLIDRMGVPNERVMLSTFMVDTEFFRPGRAKQDRPLICSAGLERRDYPTLIDAVNSLPVSVVIAAASPWSRQESSADADELPDNVTLQSLELHALRELYTRSRFVVMPLDPVEFQAGITTILEAMAMAKPVVCTSTDGQNDTIEHDVTGVYVEPRDPAALRAAIVDLLDDEDRTRRLGERARQWVVENADVRVYAARLAAEVERLAELGNRA